MGIENASGNWRDLRGQMRATTAQVDMIDKEIANRICSRIAWQSGSILIGSLDNIF
jgi:hypothetical protein